MARLRLTALMASTILASTAAGAFAQDARNATPPAPTVKDRMDKAVSAVTGNPLKNADTDMKHVMDALASLDGKPIETLSPEEARKQPTAADGVKALLQKEGKSTAPEAGVTTKDVAYDSGGQQIKARIYTPEKAGNGPHPVIVYYHGGGWVIADIDVYDATPRSIAKQTGAIVVSAEYRRAPENKFPAAHDDAVAAHKWVLSNAASFGGDPKRVALLGESAGGNLAINVAIAARDQNLQAPLYEALIYPVAQTSVDTASYKANEDAKPLNKPMMEWFVKNTVRSDADKADPRIDIVGKADLKGLPPTTVITAGIDPLHDDGTMLADKLKQAGVKVDHHNYPGATHEFFGMANVVAAAKKAQAVVVADFRKAVDEPSATGTTKAPASSMEKSKP